MKSPSCRYSLAACRPASNILVCIAPLASNQYSTYCLGDLAKMKDLELNDGVRGLFGTSGRFCPVNFLFVGLEADDFCSYFLFLSLLSLVSSSFKPGFCLVLPLPCLDRVLFGGPLAGLLSGEFILSIIPCYTKSLLLLPIRFCGLFVLFYALSSLVYAIFPWFEKV